MNMMNMVDRELQWINSIRLSITNNYPPGWQYEELGFLLRKFDLALEERASKLIGG